MLLWCGKEGGGDGVLSAVREECQREFILPNTKNKPNKKTQNPSPLIGPPHPSQIPISTAFHPIFTSPKPAQTTQTLPPSLHPPSTLPPPTEPSANPPVSSPAPPIPLPPPILPSQSHPNLTSPQSQTPLPPPSPHPPPQPAYPPLPLAGPNRPLALCPESVCVSPGAIPCLATLSPLEARRAVLRPR